MGINLVALLCFIFSIIMHYFQKLVSDLAHFCSYVQIKTGIEFALFNKVYEHKDLAFPFWDIFC